MAQVPSLQDLVNAINYTHNTAGQQAPPANCFTFECQIFDSFRQLCKNNQYSTSSLFSYTQALNLLKTFNTTKLPAGYILATEVTSALQNAGFSTTSTGITYDELICVLKLLLGKISKKLRSNNPGAYDFELEEEAANAEDMLSFLPNLKCKGYNQNLEYYDQ